MASCFAAAREGYPPEVGRAGLDRGDYQPAQNLFYGSGIPAACLVMRPETAASHPSDATISVH